MIIFLCKGILHVINRPYDSDAIIVEVTRPATILLICFSTVLMIE